MKITSVDKAQVRGRIIEQESAFSTWRRTSNHEMVRNLGPVEWYDALTWLVLRVADLSSTIKSINELWENALKLYGRVVGGEKINEKTEVPKQVLFYLMDLQVRGETDIHLDRLAAVTGLTTKAAAGALSELETMGFVFQCKSGWQLSFE